MRAKNGKFLPGESGNPAGKKVGSRHKATQACLALLDGDAEQLTRKVIELALAGDLTALALCLARLVPPARERTVNLKLPPIDSTADVPEALNAILQAVATGRIAPGQAVQLATIVSAIKSTVLCAVDPVTHQPIEVLFVHQKPLDLSDCSKEEIELALKLGLKIQDPKDGDL